MSKKLYPKFIFNSQEYKIKRTSHLYEKRKTGEDLTFRNVMDTFI